MITDYIRHHKSTVIQNGYLISFLLISLSFFSPYLIILNISIILLVLVWAFEGGLKIKFKRLSNYPLALLYIFLFILYLFGVFYTDSLYEGIKSLETKAPLIVFPLLIGSAALKPEVYRKTILFFALACVVCSLIALLYQVHVVIKENDFNYFFSDGLVLIMRKQAVYYSMYVGFSILILLKYLWDSYYRLQTWNRAAIVAAIVFLFLIIFLLASRSSMLILLVIFSTTLIVMGIRRQKYKQTALILFLLILFFTILSLLFPQTVSRFKSLQNTEFEFTNTSEIYHFSEEVEEDEKNWNGINLRLAKWICAIDVIKENPIIGVGTGDVKNEMVKSYQKRNFYFAVKRRFDPHNQFLETTVAIGIIGLLALLGCFFYPVFLAIKRRDWLLCSFMVLIIFCSLTESILSSAQGIIFFCFFLFILAKHSSSLNPTLSPHAHEEIIQDNQAA